MSCFVRLLYLATVLLSHSTLTLSSPTNLVDTATSALHTRQDDGSFVNPDDQQWMQKLAAIGDSYSAGIGAGNRIDFFCSRYDASYPYLIYLDSRMNANVQFDFQACSGAESPEITKQAEALQGEQDAILISSGGNDVGLSFILNSCIFGWIPLDSENCDLAIQIAQKKIDNILSPNLDTLLATAKTKLSANGRIYVTGYAKFFNADTDQCDSVFWNIWSFAPESTKQALTKQRRAVFNNFVDQVNTKLEAAVAKLNGQAVFVNYDPLFEALAGRYCEDGVTETDINRFDTLFFERGAPNIFKHRRRQTMNDQDLVANGTFEGMMANWVDDTLQEHPDWISDLQGQELEEFVAGNPVQIDIAVPHGPHPSNKPGNSSSGNFTGIHPAANIEIQGIPGPTWFFPDTMKRVFHPRAQGHNLIAGTVMMAMAAERAKMLGVEEILPQGDEIEVVEYCPSPAAPPAIPLACYGSNSPPVPGKVITPSSIVDPDNLLYQMRSVLCSNNCGVPAGIGSEHGAIWSQNVASGTYCEIAVGIEGGIEAYMIRDRSIETGGDQEQHCWDKTEKSELPLIRHASFP
jgi:hypothetical protein